MPKTRARARKVDKITLRKRRFHDMGKKSWEKVSLPVTLCVADMANIGKGKGLCC